MTFNNPRYFEDPPIALKSKNKKNMSKATTYLETVSKFTGEDDSDAIETVTITEAHYALNLGIVEVLEILSYTLRKDNDIDLPLLAQLINKYKKKL